MNPLISIVIPSYNKFRYIEQTLKSIFSQKYSRFEVIIQDGGSNDGTIEVIKKYVRKYPKLIKFESRQDNGQLDALNKGIKKAKGDIITFINADDEYDKQAFESIVGHFIENPNSLWFAGKGTVINEKGEEIAKLTSFYKNFLLLLNRLNILLSVNYLIQPSVFITKKAIKKYGIFTGTDFSVMEYDMWLKIGRDEMPVIVNKNISKFRIDKNTKTSKGFNKILMEDEKIVARYTKNKLVLIIHKFHNWLRTLYAKIL